MIGRNKIYFPRPVVEKPRKPVRELRHSSSRQDLKETLGWAPAHCLLPRLI